LLQPRFDVIIHKLTEDVDKKESAPKLIAIEQYLNMNPKTVIVDPIDNVRSVVSRAKCCDILSQIQRRFEEQGVRCPVNQPKYFVADTSSPSFIGFSSMMKQNKMRFPVICKPIKACGTPESHHMVIQYLFDAYLTFLLCAILFGFQAVVVDDEGFKLVTLPCVVQQYYNHDGNFFKVYVIGSDVMVFQRPSLPNLSHSEISPSAELKSLSFDSRYAYPVLSDFLMRSRLAGVNSKLICDTSIAATSDKHDLSLSPTLDPTNRKRKPTALDMPTNSPPSRFLQIDPVAPTPPPLSLDGMPLPEVKSVVVGSSEGGAAGSLLESHQISPRNVFYDESAVGIPIGINNSCAP
jgi:hypothetical protein